MSQTSVSSSIERAYAGMLFDTGPHDIVTGVSEESSAEIAFGWGVVKGTAERGVLIPSGGSDLPFGIVVHGHGYSKGPADAQLGTTGLKPDVVMSVMRKGRIWLVVDKAVSSLTSYSDRGWLRYTADGSTNPTPGAWGKATDSGKNIDLEKLVVFITGLVTLADGTKIAGAEIDFTNKP